jgi:hypothetical protein
MSAHRKILEAKEVLDKLDFYRYLLIAAAANTDESALQTQRGNRVTQTVERLNIALEQSTFVYMNCRYEKQSPKDDAFSSDPGILCDIIAQALVENECVITENKEEADYELTLITSTTQRSDGKTGQFPILTYYANAKGTLYNRATNKSTANFTIFKDADCYYEGSNPEEAATNAFKLPELRDKVLEKILPKIKN